MEMWMIQSNVSETTTLFGPIGSLVPSDKHMGWVVVVNLSTDQRKNRSWGVLHSNSRGSETHGMLKEVTSNPGCWRPDSRCVTVFMSVIAAES